MFGRSEHLLVLLLAVLVAQSRAGRNFNFADNGRIGLIESLEHVEVREYILRCFWVVFQFKKFQLKLDISPLEDHCSDMKGEADRLLSRELLGQPEGLRQMIRHASSRLHLICAEIDSIPKEGENDRKRGLLGKITTFFLSAVGLDSLFEPDSNRLALQQSKELHAVRKELDSTREQFHAMKVEVNEFEFQKLERGFESVKFQLRNYLDEKQAQDTVALFVQLTNEFDLTVGRTVRGVRTAIQEGHLSPELVTKEELKALVKRAKGRDREWNMEHILDLYQLPVSVVFGDNCFIVIVHIPVVQRWFGVFKIRPFPVMINATKRGANFKELKGYENEILAAEIGGRTGMAKSENFISGHQSVLDTCLRVKRVRFCSGLVIEKEPETNCLASIFFNKQEVVPEICNWGEMDKDWRVEQLEDNKFAIAAKRDLATTIWCGEKQTGGFIRAGIHEIKLEQGCTLMTDHFELTAADSGSWVASARIQLAENLGESLKLEKEAGLPSGRKMQAVLEQQQKLWEAVDAVKRKDEWLFEDGETHSKAVFGATAAALLGAVVALGTLGLLFTIYRCKRRDGGGHIGGTGA